VDGAFDVEPAPRSSVFLIDASTLRAFSTGRLHVTLGQLAEERSTYSLSHELAHVVLSHADNDHISMDKVFELLRLADEIAAPAKSLSFAGVASAPGLSLETSSAWPSPVSGLPPWRTASFSTLGFKDSLIDDSSASTMAEPDVIIRLASVPTLPVADLRRFVKYLAQLVADVAVAAIRQIDKVSAAVSAEMARRVALLAWNPGVRTFVLVILAVCRRYGRRSEPDDRALLPMRRHLTSWGVATPA
jgi:hypothetical protein